MSAIDELELLMQECNTDVIAVIANRLKSMDGLTRTDAIYLSNLAHTEDLNKITDILSKTAEKSKIEVNKAIEEASKENDELAEQFYKAKNLDTTVRSDVLKGIQKRAEKSMIDDILNLSHTAGFYIDGKPTSITKTYTNMINKGIYATQQGTMTYQQAIRNSIKQLADSGLRVVDFESGYSRRLDTQVRMNVLDGVRQMNMEYSTQQGKEFGADGVEVSAHGLCAKDHQMIQGRQYSIDKFKRLNNRLDRAIGTCNCYHRTYPIILGISQPAYSNEELREIDRKSNEMVTYTDKFGEEHQCSRYDATQLQRRQETLLRKLKDERNAYQTAGNDAMVKELDRKIKLQTQYYKDVSAEVGLKPRMDRARVVNPHKSATKEVPKVEKFVKEKKVDVKDLPQNMQDFIYKYTDGEYSDVCEYSQYLMTGTSKKLSLTTKPEQWEKETLPNISKDTKDNTEQLLNIINNQPVSDVKLSRIERGVLDVEQGDICTIGIRSTSKNTNLANDIFDGNFEELTPNKFNGNFTEYVFINHKGLDISDISAYKEQEEVIVAGKYKVIKTETIENIESGYKEVNGKMKDIAENVEKFTSKSGKEMYRYTYNGKQMTDTVEKFETREVSDYIYQDGQFGRKIVYLEVAE